MEKHDEIIADLEKRLTEAKRVKAKFDSLLPEQKLADKMHTQLCKHNHTDACSYLYESWDAPRDARNRELRRVTKVMSFIDGLMLEDPSSVQFACAERLLEALKD